MRHCRRDSTSMRREQHAEGRAVREMRDESNDRSLRAVVQRERSGRLEHGDRARSGATRRDIRMDADKERNEERERDRGVEKTEKSTEPPRRGIQERERGGIAERKRLS